MTPAKFKLVFDRLKEIPRKPTGLIQIECYRKGSNRVWISTGVKVKQNEWNAKRNEVDKCSNAAHINRALKKLLDDMERHEMKEFEKGIIVPLQFYKSLVKNSGEKQTFLQFFESEFQGNPSYTENTQKNYRSTYNHLLKFRAIQYFSDLTYASIEAFNRYLVKQELKDTSVEKYHKCLKHIISEAIKKGLIDRQSNPYDDFKVKVKRIKTKCLTFKEILAIEDLKFHKNQSGLERSRDMFLFSAFTGARFSDLIQVSSKTIKFKPEGIIFEYIAKKTKKPKQDNLADLFKRPIGPSRPELIAMKYKDSLGIEPFKVSLQPYNRNLKIIAKMAKIDLKLTSHVARSTYMTYMAGKVSVPVLQDLAQHDDIKTTMGYVKLYEQMKQEELKNVKWD